MKKSEIIKEIIVDVIACTDANGTESTTEKLRLLFKSLESAEWSEEKDD